MGGREEKEEEKKEEENEEEEEENEEEEEEEEWFKDYDENYRDYTDDDEIFNEQPLVSTNGNTRGPSLNLLGPSELSDKDSEKSEESEQEDKSEKEEEEVEKDAKGGCGHRFLKLCKQAGSSILGFVGGVATRIRSKISKKQALALVALTIASIKAATISSSSDPVDALEEIAENSTLEERNDDLFSDITNTVIESVVEEFAN